MISLSLRSTAHPLPFQRQWVRASSGHYPTFTLAMDRSPGFGSTPSDSSRPIQTRFPFASPLRLSSPLRSKSLTHYTKGTQSPALRQAPTACTHRVSGSLSLPSPGFFSPFPHGTGALSVGREYLALEDGPPFFRQGCSCPALLFVTHLFAISPTGLSPSLVGLSRPFRYGR